MGRRLIALLLTLSHLGSVAASAADAPRTSSFELEERQIPQKPRKPPPVHQKIPMNIPHCERIMLYQGKNQEIDSDLGNDAEHLKRLVQDVPSAVAELDAYQENRRKVKLAAYIGSAGLILAGAGLIAGSNKGLAYGGALLTAGSFGFGLGLLQSNENHLKNAVQNYNSAHPEKPIEFQFSAGFHF